MVKKRIFTFWEPKEKIPAYLQLCMKTWKKFLPDYEVVILDYSNLDTWLGKDFYPKFLYNHFSLPIQADAIRCAVLKKYGGIWLDVDTVITSEKVKSLLEKDSQFVLLNKHIAFIVAQKDAKVLKVWQKGIFKSLKIARLFYNDTTPRWVKYILKTLFAKHFSGWDCLGNRILKRVLRTKNQKIFYKIIASEIDALPEISFMKSQENPLPLPQNYARFYFENDFSADVLKNTQGIILLHNSWTPKKYSEMSEQEFLSCKTTLALVIKNLLE